MVQNPNDDSVILQAIAAASDGTVIANALNQDGPGYLFKYIGGDTVWEQFDGGAWRCGSGTKSWKTNPYRHAPVSLFPKPRNGTKKFSKVEKIF